MLTRPSSPLAAAVLLVAALGFGALAAPVQAQGRVNVGMRAGPGGMDTPSVTRADLKKFAKVLSLDEVQLETAEELLGAFQAEHQAVARKMQKDIERLSLEAQDGDFSVFRDEFPKLMEEYQKTTKAQEKRFFDDLKSLLDGKQTERWPKVERLHRRARSLPAGMLSGESVDLIGVVEDLELAEPVSPDLASILDRYEAELDRELAERDEVRQARMPGFRGGLNFDLEQIRKDMAEVRKAGVRVREVNQRYARSIEATLPEDKRAAFAEKVKRQSFPRVYRDTHTGKCLKAAAAFDDLTPEQQSAIADLSVAYERDARVVNERWAEAITAVEADGGGDPFMGMMPGGQGDDPAIADARKAKRDLDRTTQDKLAALLSDDQKAKLPEREQEGFGNMIRFGG